LQKYDWPERLVYQTPAAHRIIEKEGVIMDDGSQKLITKNELHVVVVRPKAYVSSTGTSLDFPKSAVRGSWKRRTFVTHKRAKFTGAFLLR
jgi:hypothetical protein